MKKYIKLLLSREVSDAIDDYIESLVSDYNFERYVTFEFSKGKISLEIYLYISWSQACDNFMEGWGDAEADGMAEYDHVEITSCNVYHEDDGFIGEITSEMINDFYKRK